MLHVPGGGQGTCIVHCDAAVDTCRCCLASAPLARASPVPACLVSLALSRLLAPVPLAAQSRVRAATQESTLTLLSLSLYSCLLSLARACGTCELLLCCRSHSTLCAVRPPRSPLLWARCPLLWARPVLRSSTLNPQPSLLWARPVLYLRADVVSTEFVMSKKSAGGGV